MQVVDWISKQAGKFADKFQNYKFYVKSTPQHIDSSTRLFLNAYTSRDEEALVPCQYKWSRLKNGIVSEAPQFRGNTFICEPSDVGCTLHVEITSIDQQYPGTGLLKFGPVEIDVLLKQTIESALSTGEQKFQVDLMHENRTKQCTLLITDDYMRVGHCNSSANFRFNYCMGEPLINSVPKDPTNIDMVLPQKYQSETIKFLTQLWSYMALPREEKSKQELTVSFKFVNRRCKDEFLFVMKGFNAKKELKCSSVIKKIEKLQIDESNLKFMLEIESLRKDLLRLFNMNKKVQQEKKVYMQQTLKLQKEIEDIISSYTNLIEGKFKTKEEFETSFIDFQNKKDAAISNKYKKIEQENAKLKEYIREKLDGEFQDSYNNQLKESEGRMQFTSTNAFAKKKEPFAQIELKKQNQQQYENLLQNLSAEQQLLIDQTKNYNQVVSEKEKLQEKFNKSMRKIQRLQQEINQLNRSAVIGENQSNMSMSRHNTSALEISTSKVVQEKFVIQKKYAKLKEDYAKLKAAYYSKKNTNTQSPNEQGENTNPQFIKQSGGKQMFRLKNALVAMEKEKDGWKEKAEGLAGELRKEKEESQKMKAKLEKRISQMGQELQMSRKSSDVMNRSQHLSMQMDQYNMQQTQILKEQNTFLMNENQRLTKMCEKYKSQYRKIKESKGSSESILV